MSWFTFSIISIIALAAAELTQQYLLSEEKFDEVTSGVVTPLIQSLSLFIVMLLGRNVSDLLAIFSTANLPIFLAVCVLTSVGTVLYFKGLTVKNISFSGILFSFSIVVSTSLGIIFFNESTELLKFIGLGAIMFAILAANIKNFQIESNHKYALVAGLIYGIVYTLDKKIVMQINPIHYLFWNLACISIIIFLFNTKKVVKSLKGTKLSDYAPILFAGIGYSIYNLATFKAYSLGGEVGRLDAINNSQVFLIIMFEYFVLKHTEGLARKLATAAIAIVGIGILGSI